MRILRPTSCPCTQQRSVPRFSQPTSKSIKTIQLSFLCQSLLVLCINVPVHEDCEDGRRDWTEEGDGSISPIEGVLEPRAAVVLRARALMRGAADTARVMLRDHIASLTVARTGACRRASPNNTQQVQVTWRCGLIGEPYSQSSRISEAL